MVYRALLQIQILIANTITPIIYSVFVTLNKKFNILYQPHYSDWMPDPFSRAGPGVETRVIDVKINFISFVNGQLICIMAETFEI